MKSLEIKQQLNNKISEIPHEDFHKLVNAFAWLIQEDKKQNPELYRNTKNNSILK